jgi:hypothetical protein
MTWYRGKIIELLVFGRQTQKITFRESRSGKGQIKRNNGGIESSGVGGGELGGLE